MMLLRSCVLLAAGAFSAFPHSTGKRSLVEIRHPEMAVVGRMTMVVLFGRCRMAADARSATLYLMLSLSALKKSWARLDTD